MNGKEMIQFKTGDIFNSDMETLINPCNCVGIAGAGLSLEFKKRYPESHKYYLVWSNDKPKPGTSFSFCRELEKDPKTNKMHNVICLPTKDHWKDPSKLEYVEASLALFCAMYKALKITSVAFPALGCGLGSLSWQEIEPIMLKYLEKLEIPVEIYKPFI